MANVSCTWAVALCLISLYKQYINKAASGVTVSLTCQLCSLLVYSRFVCIRNRVPNFPIFIDWISFSLNVTSRFPFQVLSVELDLWLWAFGIKCPSLQHHRTLSIYYWLQELSSISIAVLHSNDFFGVQGILTFMHLGVRVQELYRILFPPSGEFTFFKEHGGWISVI